MTIELDYESTEHGSSVIGALHTNSCHDRTVMWVTACLGSSFGSMAARAG